MALFNFRLPSKLPEPLRTTPRGKLPTCFPSKNNVTPSMLAQQRLDFIFRHEERCLDFAGEWRISRSRKNEFVLRAGHGDIYQTALKLPLLRVPSVWKQVRPKNEHRPPLRPFAGVHCAERYRSQRGANLSLSPVNRGNIFELTNKLSGAFVILPASWSNSSLVMTLEAGKR